MTTVLASSPLPACGYNLDSAMHLLHLTPLLEYIAEMTNIYVYDGCEKLLITIHQKLKGRE
jgi:hypothetical protein